MFPPIVTIEMLYRKDPPDGLPCSVCKENIYGNVYVMYTKAGEREMDTDIRLCEACYELANENNNTI